MFEPFCIHNLLSLSQPVSNQSHQIQRNNLDVAVDIHISLVQMRQHAAASLAEGKEFGQVMHDAIEAIQKERATAGTLRHRSQQMCCAGMGVFCHQFL